MEEVLQIILTIGIVIFALISSIRKRARQTMPDSESETQLPEGWPTGLPLGPIEEKRSQPKTTKRHPQRLHPDSQELLTPEIGPASPKAARSSRFHTPTGQQSHAPEQKAQHPEETQPTPSGEKHPLTADFDAKKAVIWAEILEPKYKEE